MIITNRVSINTSYATLSSDILWDIPRVTCIFSVYTHEHLGECVYQEIQMINGIFHGIPQEKATISTTFVKTLSKCLLIKMVFDLFLPLNFIPFNPQKFTMFDKFETFNQRVYILNFGGNNIAAHDGKVGCNAVEFTTAFPYSDWWYFLWHGIKKDIKYR